MSDESTCSVGNCDREVNARGWCAGHYSRWRKFGDVQADLPLRKRKAKELPKVCTVDGCGIRSASRGLCGGHYDRLLKTGDVQADIPLKAATQKGKACSVDSCPSPAFCRGWCKGHYQRWYTTGDVQADVPIGGHKREYPEGHSWCPRCEQMLTLDKFHVSKDRVRGVTAVCAGCISENVKANREKVYAGQKRWNEANADRLREIQRAWEKANPDKVREKKRRVVANNPEKYRKIARASESNRRARERSAPGCMTTAKLLARWAYYGNRCWICGDEATVTDHVKPLAAGGSNWPANTRPACVACNSKKGALWPFDPSMILSRSA